MSKELIGYTNRLQQNPDGTITKFFVDNGVTSRPARLRQFAESRALQLLSLAPNLLAETTNSIVMTAIDGENGLHTKVPEMPEKLQESVFRAGGTTLRLIHDQHRQRISEKYLPELIQTSVLTVWKIQGILQKLAIDPTSLADYFQSQLNVKEVTRSGLALIHGDYWLNNLIGRTNHNRFEVTGVVDWEMGGIDSPYSDFANVALSINEYYPLADQFFWQGYGSRPDGDTLRYFCLRQILTWLSEDKQPDFNSDFYRGKIKMLKEIL